MAKQSTAPASAPTEEFRVWAPEEIVAMQWAEFETEAENLLIMLNTRSGKAPLMARLKALHETKGGNAADYEQHQLELNKLIAEGLALPFSFGGD